MKWFKFYGQDWLSDPKMLSLSASERSCWITLLSYGSINDNGVITFLDEEQLMAQSGISPMHEEWEHTSGILKKFEKLGMITLDNANDNAKITILNWQKRQETSLTGYERVKRYREKHQNDNRDDNGMITPEEKRVDKKRIDKKRERPERHLKFLINLPDDIIQEFTKTYNIYEQGLKGKADDLYNYCKAKGKIYKDYKAFLRNAVKKDFGLRPSEDIEKQARIRATQEKSKISSNFAKDLSKKMSFNK